MRKRLSRAGERGVAKAIALPVLLLIVLAGYAGHQAPPAGQDRDPGSFRISVDVALVVLHATVTDRQGGFVSDLGEQDFEVYENGVPQRIRLFKNEDIPVTVGLVVDHSTSMRPKLAEVSAAARTFVRSSNREDEMFVVNFNEIVSLGLPAAIRFTDSTAELENAITAAPAGGQTALYDAIAKALEELQAGSRDKKVLIVVSDGGDNASARSLAQVMKLAGQSSAVIYTVGRIRRRRSGPEPGCAQAPGTGDGRRSLSSRPAQRSGGHLRAHRPGHSPSIHDRICSDQPGSRRRLSCHSGTCPGEGPRQTVRAHAHRLHSRRRTTA